MQSIFVILCFPLSYDYSDEISNLKFGFCLKVRAAIKVKAAALVVFTSSGKAAK